MLTDAIMILIVMDVGHSNRYMTITSSAGDSVRARRIISCAGIVSFIPGPTEYVVISKTWR
jgi:hypothetical protein